MPAKKNMEGAEYAEYTMAGYLPGHGKEFKEIVKNPEWVKELLKPRVTHTYTLAALLRCFAVYEKYYRKNQLRPASGEKKLSEEK